MMKKVLLIVISLLFSGLAFAQEIDAPRLMVRLGAGIPGSGADKFVEGLYSSNYGLHAIYDDYYTDTKAIPAISAECLYQVNNWFRFGAGFIYGSYSNQRIDGISDKVKEERNGQTFLLMPEAQVTYYDKGLFHMYMGISIGASYYNGYDNLRSKMSFEVEFIPVGIEFGNRIFCFAEGCLGTAVNWVHGGVGFRF